MKAAKLYSFNDIRIENIPVPEMGPNDVLIKTRACGICSGDVMPWYIEKKAPLVLGHEPAGEIVELGKEVQSSGFRVWSQRDFKDSLRLTHHSSLSVGDRVFVHHHAPCMNCRYCLRGDYVQCETWRNSKIIPGGISEFIVIPEINLRNDTLLLPDTISFEDATLIEPTACVIKSLKRAGIRRGDTALVIGLGVMGQIHILLAREFGIDRIIGADMVEFRLKKALEFGADQVIDIKKEEDILEKIRDLTDGKGAEIVIVGPNSVEAMMTGLRAVSRGGSVVLFTPARPGEILKIDPNEIYFSDINIVTSYSCGPDDTIMAMRFIEKGIVSAKKLVTHRFTIDETEKAFRITAGARDSLKCIIVF